MNKDCKYMAIGRYTKGVSVLGYMIQDIDNGSISLLERSVVEQLAIEKKINNITAQRFEGKILMKGIDCKISTLPNYDSTGLLISEENKNTKRFNEFNIVARVLNGKSTVGYIISITTNGVKCGERRLTRDKTLEIAKSGIIANARAQMCNKDIVLRGVGCKLAKLPCIKLASN